MLPVTRKSGYFTIGHVLKMVEKCQFALCLLAKCPFAKCVLAKCPSTGGGLLFSWFSGQNLKTDFEKF